MTWHPVYVNTSSFQIHHHSVNQPAVKYVVYSIVYYYYWLCRRPDRLRITSEELMSMHIKFMLRHPHPILFGPLICVKLLGL